MQLQIFQREKNQTKILFQILGRKVNWHDLAFYDSTLYESLRKLVQLAQTDPETLDQMELFFEIDDVDRIGSKVNLNKNKPY